MVPELIPLLAGETISGWTGIYPGHNLWNQSGYEIKNLEIDYPGVFHVISARDLPVIDGIHFSTAGQVILGRRYGVKMYELLYGSP